MVKIICFHGYGQNPELFRSLLRSLQKGLRHHEWVYLRGFYHKQEGGWGWYKYKDNDNDSKVWDENKEIDEKNRYSDMEKIGETIENPEETVLIGFSEGGQFALDLAQRFVSIRGIVAISPAYSNGLKKWQLTSPVVLITSVNDDRVAKRYSNKWKKCMKGEVTELNHFKGHKVYIPLKMREIIKAKMRL